jgi:hypothetical protein
MTGRQDDVGRALRSLLLEETNGMPVDTYQAAEGLQRRLAHSHKRRRVTLAVAASLAAVVVATVVGGLLGVDKVGEPAQNPNPSEVVARGFLNAYGSFDADRALTYLTNDAIARGIAESWDTPVEFRLGLAHYRAQGYKQTVKDCEHVGNSESGVSLVCTFNMHAIRSDEIGLGPYTDNRWNLTVRDGKIVSAKQHIAFRTNGFSEQMWEPFAHWVRVEHPDDVLAMYVDESQEMQRFSTESNRLWEQHTAEYAAVVTQNPAAYLDQPGVAAYVAHLVSICAAAQAKVAEETQAIPDRRINQRSSRRMSGSCVRRFRSCATSPCPRPFAGSTRDEHSRSWRSSANMGSSTRGCRRTKGSQGHCCSPGSS